MQLGMIGLGRMGNGMTERLREGGHEVCTYDPKVEERTAASLEELKGQLEAPRAFWMMIPAGKITEDVFHDLLRIADEDDTIVDGGNSNFRDTKRRYAEAQEKGIHFVDVGVSGGIWGLEIGFCLMAGGDDEPVERLEPLLQTLPPEERYGSVVRSWLLELLHAAFEQHGSQLEDIAPYVEDSGEGRWTINEAIEENVPAPVIAASLFARFASRDEIKFSAKVAAALRNQFGGHAVRAVERAKAGPDPR